jgi:hypothetical protein
MGGAMREGPDSRTCPFCAESIQPAAIVCKHCHRDLPAAAGALKRSVDRPTIVLILLGVIAVAGVSIFNALMDPVASVGRVDDKDWHPAGDHEVRWMAGRCFTRTSRNATQFVTVPENYCILFGAKNTPLGVPEERP